MSGRKPVGEVGQKEQVLEFVRANPGCTSVDIKRHCSIPTVSLVGCYLTRLRHAGLVKRDRAKGQVMTKWSAIDEDTLPGAARCFVVKTEWDGVIPQMFEPMAALFGREP